MNSSSDDAGNPSPEALKQVLDSLSEYSISIGRIKFHKTAKLAGEGGFGKVRLAHLRSGSMMQFFEKPITVAVKELHPAGTEMPLRTAYRLAREMKVWAACKHENVLEFWGFHLSKDFQTAYLLSPYMKNGNVKDYLVREAPPLEHRLELVLDTIRGLEYLHSRDPPVVHGDLKVLNVVLNDNGKALLCDFGLARAQQAAPTGLSTGKGFKGTFRYSSPEALDFSQMECPSDIWSWACLAQEMMTDKCPYPNLRNEAIIITKICGEEGRKTKEDRRIPKDFTPPALSETGVASPRLLELLEKCWNFLPEDRPTSTMCLTEMQSIYCATTGKLIPEPTSESTTTLSTTPPLRNSALRNAEAGTSGLSVQTPSTQSSSGRGQFPRIPGAKALVKRYVGPGKAPSKRNPKPSQ